jgi:hypothetical protein
VVAYTVTIPTWHTVKGIIKFPDTYTNGAFLAAGHDLVFVIVEQRTHGLQDLDHAYTPTTLRGEFE